MKLHFLFSEEAEVQQGLAKVLPLLRAEEGEDGIPVHICRGERFEVSRKGDTAQIVYTIRVELFRGLAILVEHWQEGDFCIKEQRRFASCGIMIDCSRGAVPKPETIEWFQCRMALMGANLLMLYTEDTYEVPGRPYFGYLRGRYTQAELRRMDESAWQLGIEMIPCIQTLGHLERALQWYRPFENVRDTAEVLYDGAEANVRSLLLGVQMYCEYNYTGRLDMPWLENRFRVCAGASAESFYNISKLNVVPGIPLQKAAPTSVIKALLYEDPLMPILEADFAQLLDGTYFKNLAGLYGTYAQEYAAYDKMFSYYQALAKTAELKCDWHNRAACVARNRDLSQIPQLCRLAEDLICQLTALSRVWAELWYCDNKPFGFEVLDIRIGGCIQRFRTAITRLRAFERGELSDIEELTCEKLPFLRNEAGEIESGSNWGRIASACRFV